MEDDIPSQRSLPQSRTEPALVPEDSVLRPARSVCAVSGLFFLGALIWCIFAASLALADMRRVCQHPFQDPHTALLAGPLAGPLVAPPVGFAADELRPARAPQVQLTSDELRPSTAPSTRLSRCAAVYGIAASGILPSLSVELPQSFRRSSPWLHAHRSRPGHRGPIFYALPPPTV